MAESVVSDHILEKNILKCFSGLHRTQYFLGSVRTVMRGRVVELPNIRHNLYSLVFVVCAAFSEVYYQTFYYRAFYHKNKMMFYSCFIGTCFGFFSYNTCLFVSRFTNRDLNVKIYYNLQKIDRILQLTHISYFTDFQATFQNRLNAMICFFFPLGFLLHAWAILDRPMMIGFLIPSILTIYVDNLLLGALLYYIAVRLSIFNKMVENHIGIYEDENREPNSSGTLVKMIMSLVIPSYDRIDNTLEWNRWLKCVQQTLKSYEMINEIFNYQVSFINTLFQ